MKKQTIPSEFPEQVIILDCTAYSRQSLIQGDKGTPSLCTALFDISWFCDYEFPSINGQAKAVTMTVTRVDTHQGGNALGCSFCVEVKYRHYSVKEILDLIKKHTFCKIELSAAEPDTEWPV